MKRILSLIGAGGLALLAVVSTQADIVSCNQPGTGLPGGTESPNVVGGTPFTVGSSPLTIVALGYFDVYGTGLVHSHDVGIYDLSQNLLGSVTVGTGSGVTYHDGTRWAALSTPISLATNMGYMLAYTTVPHVNDDPPWGDSYGNSANV
jgi:hypothetical protein